MWSRRLLIALASLAGASMLSAGEPAASNLAPPVLIQAAGKPIDVDIGHAAPCFADLDGDGKMHLLVGQFGEGKLRIYRNTGSKTEPRFDKCELFQAGGTDGNVPSG